MKKMINKISLLLGALVLIASCDDFEEININPTAASSDQVQVEYFINNSIGKAQMDPGVAERSFVLYWKDAGHMDRIGTLSEGWYHDGWTSVYFNQVSGWLRDINTAIRVADEQIESGNIKVYTNNLKQVARIWRAYLMTEMADNFGPIPVDGFKGVNPDYDSVEDVYKFLLAELKDATNSIDESVINPNNLAALDPAYGYNYEKWVKYGNSMRMRVAMRLSEVDAATAQEEFQDAVGSGKYISSLDDNMGVQEIGGWNSYVGVMTRQWNMQYLSPTSNNLMIGLGGVESEDQLSDDKHQYIKDGDYMGLKYDDHFTTLTNDPSAGFWFDGLHEVIDPRAYKAYKIPGDVEDPDFNYFPSWSSAATTTERNLLDDDSEVLQTIDAAFTWNSLTTGEWGAKGSKNQLSYPGTHPRLSHIYRDSDAIRIFYASWESYFLIAEAAVRGWAVPLSGQEAYEMGISESFTYAEVPQHLGTYLTSDDYNRVGTSVSWSHTAEPPATVTKDFIDGYTGAAGTVNVKFPDNTIYQGGGVKNDLLTKIITQKFIAQTPWLPLETWNDHRRLGLPFFENPAVENPIEGLPELNQSNYMTNSVKFFGQRLKYPSGFANNVPDGYQQAVEKLGGEDVVLTPLWWAQQN